MHDHREYKPSLTTGWTRGQSGSSLLSDDLLDLESLTNNYELNLKIQNIQELGNVRLYELKCSP